MSCLNLSLATTNSLFVQALISSNNIVAETAPAKKGSIRNLPFHAHTAMKIVLTGLYRQPGSSSCAAKGRLLLHRSTKRCDALLGPILGRLAVVKSLKLYSGQLIATLIVKAILYA